MNMRKTEEFFEALEKAGLSKAFSKMSDIAFNTLDAYLEDIVDDAVYEMQKPVCRVRYEKKDGKEWYIFETRQNEEDEFGLDTAYELQNDMIYYQALTQVRELFRLGYDITFK